MHSIETQAIWSVELTEQVLTFLQSQGIYLTNVVKWTGPDGSLPDAAKIALFEPILKKEIEIVQPAFIVTFGIIPFETLTRKKIKLRDSYEHMRKTKTVQTHELQINSFKTTIIPCYFPVGRGEPKKAVEILWLIRKMIFAKNQFPCVSDTLSKSR